MMLSQRKIIAVLLAFILISGQVFAGPLNVSGNKFAPSLVTDPDINPARSAPIQNAIASKAEPGAIGNGAPLMELAQGKLPPRITLPDDQAQVLNEAIRLAVRTSFLNQESIPMAQRERVRKAMGNLIDIQNNLTGRAYLYNADVRGPEDYLLGFNAGEEIGLSVELIDRLNAISSRRLAQYIFRMAIPEKGIITKRDDHRAVYNEILRAIFGADEVAALEADLLNLINERNIVPTLKFPGTPALVSGSAEHKALIDGIKANVDRQLSHDELIRIRNIIQSKAPPTFLSDKEKASLVDITGALTGQSLDVRLKNLIYKDKQLHRIKVMLVDLRGDRYFSTNEDNFYQAVEDYDEAAKELHIYIPKAFFEEYYPKSDTTAVTQTVLHPLLETILGLSHQEAALALSFYNSDDTVAKPGAIAVSDAHLAIIREMRTRAINGNKAAIRQLNTLLNPNFKFSLSGADKKTLQSRGRSVEAIDELRIHSEELARMINGLARGPIGKFETKADIKDVKDPGFIAGKMPTQEILNEYSLAANAAIAAALAVLADGYVGKVSELTSNAEIKIIKDGADGLAKKEMQVIFQLSGYRIIITVSEGGLRDEVEESFMGGETIGAEGLEVVSVALDVVENTNAVARGKDGGTSLLFSAKGKDATLLGNVPDVYAFLITYFVPPEKIKEFEEKPLDPGPYTGEEDTETLMPIIKEQLYRIAEANGVKLDRMEVTLLDRDRESVRQKVFEQLAQEEGLKVTMIEDGTVNSAIRAALGGNKEERLKVFFGTGGAPEHFATVIAAAPFHKEGACASLRIASNAGLKKANDLRPFGAYSLDKVNPTDPAEILMSHSGAYGFDNSERDMIQTLRPDDYAEILKGKKLFTTADVKGEIDGAITFITKNGVFALPGIVRSGDNEYIVTTLRFSEKDGEGYRWIQSNKVSITPLGTSVSPSRVPETISNISRAEEADMYGAPLTPAQKIEEGVTREQYIHDTYVKEDAVALRQTLVGLGIDTDRMKKKVLILYDTAIDPNLDTVHIARAGEVAVNKYMNDAITVVRGTGKALRDAPDVHKALKAGDAIVTIAGDSTLKEIGQDGLKDLGKIINVQNPDNRHIPVIGLYDLALKIAYDLGDERILECLNRIAIRGPNDPTPFTMEDIRRGVIRILPKIRPVDMAEAVEAYKAAQAALASL
ncbi:MAG: fructose-bisphosphatase class II [Candidatus Omnitrophica bacterium]|nr:fructose-bisphosphatase class II [Candidatus Omnitrophota bacterium]